jgi:hypothetical protein
MPTRLCRVCSRAGALPARSVLIEGRGYQHCYTVTVCKPCWEIFETMLLEAQCRERNFSRQDALDLISVGGG